jgi:hypothetical protein
MLQIQMTLSDLKEILEGDLLASVSDYTDSLTNPIAAQLDERDRETLAQIIILSRDLAERLSK